MGRTALVIGATGLVGTTLVNKLLVNRDYDKVVVLVRRKLSFTHQKLDEYVINFDNLEEEFPNVNVDDVYCCMGTTIKKAKTKDNMYKIDVEYPLAVAKVAKERGLKHYILISSIGANAQSMFFYTRIKGELEEQLQELDLPKLTILQPSFLVGKRKEKRINEKVFIHLYSGCSKVLPNTVKNKLGIEVYKVADAMMKSVIHQTDDTKTLDVEAIRELAEK